MHEDNPSNIRTHAEAFAPVDLGDCEPARLLDKRQAARLLGDITVREVENRVSDGDLEQVKLGRRALIVAESLDRYVARLRREAAARREAVPA
jgi:hypothetical protein